MQRTLSSVRERAAAIGSAVALTLASVGVSAARADVTVADDWDLVVGGAPGQNLYDGFMSYGGNNVVSEVRDGNIWGRFAVHNPYWGQFKARTRPSPGNHEYETAGASGYFDYFGAAAGDPDKGYYSYDLGSWHLVALNSNCEEIRCDPGSPQGRWLEEDLAANDEVACTLAYFHHPLFTSGEYRPGIKRVEHLWEILYDAGVDVVLNGHDHNYQRFAPQDPQGRADPEAGIRQFVVGTGGRGLYQIPHPIANAEVYDDNTHGVLELTLHPKRYDWEFVPVEGETFSDSGVALCH